MLIRITTYLYNYKLFTDVITELELISLIDFTQGCWKQEIVDEVIQRYDLVLQTFRNRKALILH